MGAGADTAITLPMDTVALNGTVSDDGLPAGTLLLNWSGPAGVVFADAAAEDTTATFPA